MSKNKSLLFAIGAILVLGGIFSYSALDRKAPQKDDFSVSWMRTWATTGQIMTVLANTNIASLHGSNATFPNFLFGPEMNEAARSGQVDATNTGIVPTTNLLAVDDDWVVVARLIYFNVSLVVPQNSGIKNIADLSGKSVGVPFGGGSHPYILQRLGEDGIKVGDGKGEVSLVNLKPPEQALALARGEVDAVATWEPQTAISLDKAEGKVIDEDIHVGFITVRKSLAEKYPNKVVALLKAYIDANLFVAQNPNMVDAWFVKKSQFDPVLLSRIKVIEPNIGADAIKDVNILISDKDFARSQKVADIMFENNLTPKRVDIKGRTDMSYLERAIKDLSSEGTRKGEIVILE
uniref:ABC-type nitrate/sulfonate/bicarbonate transport system, substrate-binding protein n=1 Tax=Candidatus Kentrum sp. SD TaxID=2126332 RepID=A0A451BK59_9GAMM|nr:MAG: ABC-type nitrate/sulfonate/bicarbonate transport system, substrate-binding protein [Candidatus Kentron sp. SD]VFK42895.1 MAG: ABC-type nitrate/sulfonate/bicarbonate transport system, substrate-binding protein [Candidatus Kentron sp. SD]VFK78677.1 MAG: ABC-type nitrate/sulfonate/bicarbonate transport system, substrate-binding protein [Candidatus Kentron sp. SD]